MELLLASPPTSGELIFDDIPQIRVFELHHVRAFFISPPRATLGKAVKDRRAKIVGIGWRVKLEFEAVKVVAERGREEGRRLLRYHRHLLLHGADETFVATVDAEGDGVLTVQNVYGFLFASVIVIGGEGNLGVWG